MFERANPPSPDQLASTLFGVVYGRALWGLLCVCAFLLMGCGPSPLKIVLLYENADLSSLKEAGVVVELQTRFPDGRVVDTTITDGQQLEARYPCPEAMSSKLIVFEVRVKRPRDRSSLIGRAPLTPDACQKQRVHVFLNKPNVWHPTLSLKGDVVERLKLKLVGHEITPLPDGRLLISGGARGLQKAGSLLQPKDLSEQLWFFDPGLSTLEPAATLSRPRAFHSALLIDRRVYILGGLGADGPLDSIERFDFDEKGRLAKVSEDKLERASAFHRTVGSLAGTVGALHVVGGIPGAAGELGLGFHSVTWLPARSEVLILGGVFVDVTGKIQGANRYGWVFKLDRLKGRLSVRLKKRQEGGGEVERPVLTLGGGEEIWPQVTMGLERVGHTATLTVDGEVLVLGGLVPKKDATSLFAFEKILGVAELVVRVGESWKVESLLFSRKGAEHRSVQFEPRVFHSATSVGGRILIAGGFEEKGVGGVVSLSSLLLTPGARGEGGRRFLVEEISGTPEKGRFLHRAVRMGEGGGIAKILFLGGVEGWAQDLTSMQVAEQAFSVSLSEKLEEAASWFLSLSSPVAMGPKRVLADVLGNLYVAVFFKERLELGEGRALVGAAGYQLALLKFSGAGTLLWAEKVGGALSLEEPEQEGLGFAIDASGALYLGFRFAGGLALFGTTAGVSKEGSCLMKIEPKEKKVLWTKIFEFSGQIRGLAVDESKGVLWATGFFEADGRAVFGKVVETKGEKIFAVKMTQKGSTVEVEKLYYARGVLGEPSRANALALAPSGVVYLTGHYSGKSVFEGAELGKVSDDRDLFLLKIGADGKIGWVTTAGGTGPDSGMSVVIDGQGDPIVSGGLGSDFFLVLESGDQLPVYGRLGGALLATKWSKSTGKLLWRAEFAIKNNDCPTICVETRKAAVSASNEVYFAGLFNGQYAPLPEIEAIKTGGIDSFLLMYSPNGHFKTMHTLGELPLSRPLSQKVDDFIVDSNGDLIFVGSFEEQIYSDQGISLKTGEPGILNNLPHNLFVWKREDLHKRP